MQIGIKTLRKVSADIAKAVSECSTLQARVNVYH